jgi:hypothetical protein
VEEKNKNLLPIKGAVLDGEILPSAAAGEPGEDPRAEAAAGPGGSPPQAPLVCLATVTQGPNANLAGC